MQSLRCWDDKLKQEYNLLVSMADCVDYIDYVDCVDCVDC
ncbi:unnamed protein product [marine sediment metagenome]|uniref:Uncharacterized protein n=1 Tax=marine sediment metagenome TaxID=412755 RepID=X1DCA4_9ZZZZ